MYKFILLIACIIITSCNVSDMPKNILPADKMRPILWQQIKADIYTRENLVIDSLKKYDLSLENIKLQNQILKNFGITKEQFYESYNYYLVNEDKLGIMIDTMIAQQTKAGFDELATQADKYKEKPKNIFVEEILKKQSIFSMSPDTLEKQKNLNTRAENLEMEMKYNPHFKRKINSTF